MKSGFFNIGVKKEVNLDLSLSLQTDLHAFKTIWNEHVHKNPISKNLVAFQSRYISSSARWLQCTCDRKTPSGRVQPLHMSAMNKVNSKYSQNASSWFTVLSRWHNRDKLSQHYSITKYTANFLSQNAELQATRIVTLNFEDLATKAKFINMYVAA